VAQIIVSSARGRISVPWISAGLLLLAAVLLLETGLVPLSSSVIDFYYYAVFLSGVLLAWRFHSSRVLFALITLLLAHRALEFFAAGSVSASGPGHIAFEAIAFLLPVNFVILAAVRERGLVLPSIAFNFCLLFVEAVFVAIICRPGQTTGPGFLHSTFLGQDLFGWTIIPPSPFCSPVFCFIASQWKVVCSGRWRLRF